MNEYLIILKKEQRRLSEINQGLDTNDEIESKLYYQNIKKLEGINDEIKRLEKI